MEVREEKMRRHFGSLFVFILLTALFLLAPTTHDDWYYEHGNTLFNLITVSSPSWYQNLNGRILGNALESITGGIHWLRAIVQSGIVFGIWKIAERTICASKCGSLLLLSAILIIPAEIYAQTYGWSAGFFNYVPEVLLLLAVIFLIFRAHEHEPGHTILLCLSVGLLSFCTQLFSENVTVINLFVGICLIVSGLVLHRKSFALPLAAGAGLVLGGIVMFLSPAYRSSAYYSAADSASLFETILGNYQTVSLYTFRIHILATLILTLSLVTLIFRSKDQRKNVSNGLAVVLMLCQCYFIVLHVILEDDINLHGQRMTDAIDFLVNAVYAICALLGILYFVKDKRTKFVSTAMIVLAIAYAAPLLVVAPIGPRCFYSTYMYILIGAFAVGEYTFASLLSKTDGVHLAATVVCGCALCLCLFVNTKNHRIYTQRIDTIQQEMASGETTIELRSYPYPQFVWGANSQTIGVYYYYDQPGDILFTYVD